MVINSMFKNRIPWIKMTSAQFWAKSLRANMNTIFKKVPTENKVEGNLLCFEPYYIIKYLDIENVNTAQGKIRSNESIIEQNLTEAIERKMKTEWRE